MQQIINLFIKNSYKLLFLLLLGIGLLLTIKSHSYHRSQYINSASGISGWFYNNLSDLKEYIGLKEKNAQLATENARLKQLLFNQKDTLISNTEIIENKNAIYKVRKAKVIKNVYATRENYLTLNIGQKDSIKTDMGVMNDLGVIGIVDKTSKHYATVQSILNTKSKISAKIKGTNHFGTLEWDGKNTGFVQLNDVPRLAALRKGDSIVTGANSDIFPENIPIGKIESATKNVKTNYYNIQVRLFNDMTSLGYVYIIENKQRKEIKELENQETP